MTKVYEKTKPIKINNFKFLAPKTTKNSDNRTKLCSRLKTTTNLSKRSRV